MGSSFFAVLITELEDYVIVQVSAGDSHSAFLTDEGLVFATGTFRVGRNKLEYTLYIYINTVKPWSFRPCF